jgi:hypothetical protein
VRDARPSIQNAFRRIQTLPTFVSSLCFMLVQVNEFACCSRTDSPFTHQRPRQRVVASFRLGRAPRFALRLAVIARREMRPNRLLPPNTFSTTSTRASWIPDVESRDFRLVLIREPSVSRRPIRFGGPCGFVSWGGVFFPKLSRACAQATSRPTVPLAPLSPPRLLPMALPHALIVIRVAKIVFTARP